MFTFKLYFLELQDNKMQVSHISLKIKIKFSLLYIYLTSPICVLERKIQRFVDLKMGGLKETNFYQFRMQENVVDCHVEGSR